MRIFSGVQPTGEIHIGNYLGAIKQWINLQESNECFYCIVDLHALTSDYDPGKLQDAVLKTAIVYLAAGLDPEKANIFAQSRVPAHTELCWLLNTITPIGELKRMTQYKEKTEDKKKSANAGLLNYPVLMASDILLYDTEMVPVGDDQKQHLELTRDIARNFNNKFGETFEIPEPKFPKEGARIMSLRNPKNKMSKSGRKGNAISLFDDPDSIKDKVMKAVTDSGEEIKYDPENKEAISNLLVIYSEFADQSIAETEEEMNDKTYKELKEELSDLLIEKLHPFRKKKKKLEDRREVYVQEILDQGANRANSLASSKIKEVKRKMGLK